MNIASAETNEVALARCCQRISHNIRFRFVMNFRGAHMKKGLWLSSVAAVAMTAASAQGADLARKMPVKAPPATVAPPPFSWTSCYVGGHGGGGWGNTNWSDRSPGLPDFPNFFFVGADSPGSLDTNKSGWLAGGQIGCDLQVNSWVFGLEASASATGIKGDETNPFFVNKTLHTETDWLASVTPRIGYSWDRWLIYARGGVAWSHNKFHAFDADDVAAFDQSDTRTGWVVG